MRLGVAPRCFHMPQALSRVLRCMSSLSSVQSRRRVCRIDSSVRFDNNHTGSVGAWSTCRGGCTPPALRSKPGVDIVTAQRMVAMKYRRMWLALCLLFITAFSLGPEPVHAQSSPSELGTLQKDMETVKNDLAAIKKELSEIRQLLIQRPLQPATPARVMSRVKVGDGYSLGKPDAPVTLVEFSDYQCPFCGRFFNQTFAALKTQYIDTGKVRYVFRDFPLDQLHPQARKAAEAAHCAGEQRKYWEMHDTMFKNQRTLKVENLKGFASELGLDVTAFSSCLDEGKYAAAVSQHHAAGSELGVTGTPAFFVGKSPLDGTIEATAIKGAQPITAFRQAIDRLLDGKNP